MANKADYIGFSLACEVFGLGQVICRGRGNVIIDDACCISSKTVQYSSISCLLFWVIACSGRCSKLLAGAKNAFSAANATTTTAYIDCFEIGT